MIKELIKKVPVLYDFYRVIKTKKQIREINNRAKLSWDDQIALVEKTYATRVGHPLDWCNLRTYTEKMQWAKMYDYDPVKSLLSDKYAVRNWIKEKIGEKYLIPLLGCWESFDEIDFDSLPEQFVLKTNNGSGTNLIVRDKSKLDLKKTKRLVNNWLETKFDCKNPFEYQYRDIEPKIIAEKFMKTETEDLLDYKFLCFDGKPYFCWVDIDRHSNHKRNIYDMEWILQSWNQWCYGNYEKEIPCPNCFEEMKCLAAVLSQGFSHVRVDLYLINDQIFFGEMTFTNGSGYERIVPDEADLQLGNLWQIDTSKKDCGYSINNSANIYP